MQSHRRRAAFRPSFTLMLLYVAGLSIAFSLLAILPEMLEALAALPPDVDPAEAGREVARAVAAPRVAGSIAIATIAVGAGAYWRVLPGLRGEPRS